MRIVHTSDWHAGRRWKGVDRLKELQAVLDHMATWIGDNGVDLLLHTGDVFDNGAPAARAERVVFRFLKRIGDAGVKSVVIAGNHDNARRLEAWGILAELVGVHVVGRPRNADEGGVLTLTTTSGETAKVACVPFAAVRDLISAADLAEDDAAARTSYADIRRAVRSCWPVPTSCAGWSDRWPRRSHPRR